MTDFKIQAWCAEAHDSIAARPPRRRIHTIYRRGVGTINEQRRNKRAKKVKNSSIIRRIHEVEHKACDSLHPLVGHSPNQKDEPIDGDPPIHRRWHIRYSFVGGATTGNAPYNPRLKPEPYTYQKSAGRLYVADHINRIEIL